MVRTGAEVTVVVIDGPVSVAISLQAPVCAPLVIVVPFASGLATLTTIWTDPLLPAFRAPIAQVTEPAPAAPPPVALTKVVFAGSPAVISTPLALAVPLFQ